ncbi:hypothetical protein EVJ22_15100 [Exiguobacterium sp. SH0S7]|uniref:hypothetical protein n=1 Tax=Exiguobacterium sp. SH0S7 TaxID=2510951 RepID=UPI001040CE63|nr:hypothetical protein [Exiguobacterium sp. SH0S7]TCI66840.1 hypothetical protein EVJ22_15100 [Exiguobacterium sp. SH0S7]
MADYLPLLSSVITGLFGYFIAKFNANSVLKQKMIDKDLEKSKQEEVYEEKIESLKIQYEQELKLKEIEHKHSLEKLEAETRMKVTAAQAEAKIKMSSAEDERILKHTDRFLTDIMSGENGMMNLINALSASERGEDTSEIMKQLIMNKQSGTQGKQFQGGGKSNSNNKRRNVKKR